MSDMQPRKPAGTPEGGQYDVKTGGGSDADLDEWALTVDLQRNPFDSTPVDMPNLETDIIAALPERYAGSRILSFDANGVVTGIDADGRKFTDTTDPQVSRLTWSVPDDLSEPPRTQERLEKAGEGWLTVPGGLSDAGRPKRVSGEPWCVRAAKRRYADRYADVRALQDGHIVVELTDGTIRIMDAPDWVPAQPRNMRRIHVASGRWRLVPADSLDDGQIMTGVTKADLEYYAKLGERVAGPEFDHVIRVDGTGRLTIRLTDGTKGAIQLPDDEPRPIPGATLRCSDDDGNDGPYRPEFEADDTKRPERKPVRKTAKKTAPAPDSRPARPNRLVEVASSILAPLVSLFLR